MTGIEPSPGGTRDDRPRATSFVTVVARSWRWYRGNGGPLIRLFGSVSVLNLIGQAPLFAFDDPPFALSFMMGVLFPAVTYGYAYGVTAQILQRDSEDDPVRAATATRELRPHTRAIVNAAVLGSALTALNPLSPIVPALFYGPPLLMQVVAVEGRELRDAWNRTRAIMHGTWGRVILFLISLSLALGALLQTVFGLVFVAIDGLSDDAKSAILLGGLTVFMTFALPYLAAAQFELFDDVREPDSEV